MKALKIITLALTISLCLSPGQKLYGQFEENLYILHYSNSEGERGKTTFIYNGRAHPYKAIWELEDGSRWSVNLHEFNARGQMIRKTREFSDSVQIEQNFTYNELDHLIHETFKRSDGISGEVYYTYKNGLCKQAICKNFQGWFTGRIQYFHGPDALKDSALLVSGEKRLGLITYFYNADHQLIKETWTFHQGFKQEFRYEYLPVSCTPFHSSNVFIEPSCTWQVVQEHYDFNGEGGGPSYYTYDESNRLLNKTYVRKDGLKTETTYNYSSDGHLIESVRHYNDGSLGIFSYHYNSSGQLINRIFIKDGSESSSENYTYDRVGRLIEGRYVNFDGWLTGKLEFSNDRFDRLAEARFISEDDRDATLYFTYDQNSRLVKILWKFDKGYTQTYIFEYMARSHFQTPLSYNYHVF
jgi:hypothetical protein